MKTAELAFDLPPSLAASVPPEARGVGRDGVRLLIMRRHTGETEHVGFRDLPAFLRPGDLLVVNTSGTIPASLPARWKGRAIRVHLSTDLQDGCWIVEPRTASGEPFAEELEHGDLLEVANSPEAMEVLGRYRGFARLWSVRAEGDLLAAASRGGEPIRYGYVEGRWPLSCYQTVFAKEPGSAEMPSAARPFTHRLAALLRRRGVRFAEVVLHTGVSSHELTSYQVEDHQVYPEWYLVSEQAAAAVNAAREEGRSVIAVGTTVVRALETASDGSGRVRPGSGFTELFIKDGYRLRAVDGLLTGLHPPVTSHLAMLCAFAVLPHLKAAYEEAIHRGYLWHEFGDANLIL